MLLFKITNLKTNIVHAGGEAFKLTTGQYDYIWLAGGIIDNVMALHVSHMFVTGLREMTVNNAWKFERLD